jgi:hypothetical protein
MKRTKLIKVYANGGELYGALGGGAATILDGFTPTGRPPSLGLGVAKGVASGVAAGAQFGPWGAAVGGVIGGVGGLISTRNQQRAEINRQGLERYSTQNQEMAKSAAALAGNPSLVYGNRNAEYFEMGGQLKGKNFMSQVPQSGGKLQPLSSKHTEVVGPSHEQGGVQLPGFQAEVEGMETTSGDKVFSAELGFAQLHKPIAKAIGKIESKAFTTERINALQRLKEREDALYNQQEQLKATLYGQ